MFAKLENGILRPAPRKVVYEGNTVLNPSADKLLALGYLPVKYTSSPPDAPVGQHYEPHWEEKDGEIVQAWTIEDDPIYPDPEPTMLDLEAAIERGMTT